MGGYLVMSLREFQKANNLTNNEMAAILGISPSNYCDKLQGRRRFKAREAVELCIAFNLDVTQIIEFRH